MDIRTEKTKRSIYNAFICIRSRKSLEKLTVKELCEMAQINKSTFYVYYKDVYDLSDKIESEIVSSVIKNLGNADDIFDNPKEFTRNLFIAYASQSSLITTVFSGTRSERLPDRIEAALKDMIFTDHPEFKFSKEKSLFITFSVYGGYYTYSKNQNYSLDEVVDSISDMTGKLIK